MNHSSRVSADEILKNYIAKHADGFFGKGKPKDAIRIRDEAKQALHTALVACVEDTVMILTNDLPSLLGQDEVYKIRQQHKKEIIKNIDNFFGVKE